MQLSHLTFRDGRFAAQRGSDGSVDVAQSIRPEFVENAIRTIEEQFAGWRIEVPDIQGERLELAWADADVSSPVRLAAQMERLALKGLSNLTNQPITVESEARWGTNGTLKLTAEGTLIPASALTRIEFAHVRLTNLQPYVAKIVNLSIRRGEVAGQWTLGYNRQPGGPLLSLEGGLEVSDFLAFDTLAGRDFLKWEAFQVRSTRGAWEPAQVTIQEIHLQAPATSFVLMTNGQFNVLSLLRVSTNATGGPTNRTSVPPSPFAAFPLQLNLERLTLTNGSLYAVDQTVPGEFSATLERVSGSVTDLAWPGIKKSHVELAGFVGPRAPFTVDGWVHPDPARMSLDMHVTTANAELIPFTPYSIKFAGYPLKEGRLTADVRYQVEGRQVQGENKIRVDRLTLGPKANRNPILDLPVKLGIALLKDSDGRINLDIPVKGSLDDPEFGVSKVVWQAVKGLFVKVATAPFKLLGSLFGGSEEDGQALQTVEFEAGASQLAATATNKLERLVKALDKRPELLVALRGGASPEADGPALAFAKLTQEVRQLQATDPNSTATNLPITEASLTSGEYAPLLAQVFTNRFLGPDVIVAPTAQPAVVPPTDGSAVPVTVPPTPADMERRLLEQMRPTKAELNSLRVARVTTVTEWLLGNGRLTPDRVVPPDPAETNAPPLLEPVVEFSLE